MSPETQTKGDSVEKYMRRTDGGWEHVDEYIEKNWKKALMDGKPRYDGTTFVRDGVEIIYNGHRFRPKELLAMIRLLGFKTVEGSTPLEDIKEPVLFRFGNKQVQRNPDGTLWTKQMPKVTKEIAIAA